MPAGRPLKFDDIEALKEAINTFFSECDITNRPYTITGLALALDTSRKLLCEYENRPEFSNAIKLAKTKIERFAEEKLYAGSPAGPIFALKNFDWSDRVEQDTTIKGDRDNPVQHNHTGKVEMGAELIAQTIERLTGKTTNDSSS